MAQNSQLLQLAQDPGTPLQTLQQLAQNYPGLRSAIALNPSTYPALLDWLRDLHDPAVDAALAQRAGYLAGGHAATPSFPVNAAASQGATPHSGQHAPAAAAASPLPQSGAANPSSLAAAQTTVLPTPAGLPAQANSPFAPVSAATPPRSGDPLDGTGTQDDDDSGGGALPWVIGALALILVAVIIYMAFTLFGPANRKVDHTPGPQVTSVAPAPAPQETEATSPTPTPPPSESGRTVPADALNMDGFYSPSRNIGCSLGEDEAFCVMAQHNQTTEAGCAPYEAVAVAIDNAGVITEHCSGADGELPTLEYGQTATNQIFACTSLESGMTCWHIGTGRGFTMSREAIVKD